MACVWVNKVRVIEECSAAGLPQTMFYLRGMDDTWQWVDLAEASELIDQANPMQVTAETLLSYLNYGSLGVYIVLSDGYVVQTADITSAAWGVDGDYDWDVMPFGWAGDYAGAYSIHPQDKWSSGTSTLTIVFTVDIDGVVTELPPFIVEVV